MTDMDIVEFLTARYDEMERELNDPFDDLANVGGFGIDEMRRDLAAKQRILELHAATDDGSGELCVCGTCCGPSESWERLALRYPCPTLKLLAAPYADRPGYNPAWTVD